LGARIWETLIVDLWAGGWTNAEIVKNSPGLHEDGVHACIAYTVETTRERYVEIEV
jgi:uncharacterized protein (DUF433 family)